MRIKLLIIFSLIASFLLANSGEELNEVWIDGSSFYRSIDHKRESTIYFDAWSPFAQQFMDDKDYFVALQLEKQFDPIPEDADELPNLTALAAIGSELVLDDYLLFLENYGRTKGINYLILPDTIGLSSIEKRVLDRAVRQSPYYFIQKSTLSHTIPASKKDFNLGVTDNPTIWVATQDHEGLSKLQRWSSKYLRKSQFSYLSSLRNARKTKFDPTWTLSEKLKEAVFKESVVALDANHQLPIRSDTISYLGNNRKLKSWLSRYAVILEKRKDGVIALLDDANQPVRETDIVVTKTPALSSEHTHLVIPFSYSGHEVLLAKMLFGATDIMGQHPLGRVIVNQGSLGYADPSHVGLDKQYLELIDTLAEHAIKSFATPGMQIAVVKSGDLVSQRNYGYFTYDSITRVNDQTIYDVASLTKVVATLPALALLLDRGKLSLDDTVGYHLKDFAKSNKSGVTIRELLAHNGGLRSYIPFWDMRLDGDRLDPFYYKTPEDEAQDIRTYGLEPHPVLVDTVKGYIVKSNLIKNPENYHYSDLGFMILHMIVEEVADEPLDQFLQREFYGPMGLTRTTFNPRSKGFTYDEIAPTEFDHRYRNYQVWGEVHDRNALVFGGVAGHAGLFSTAEDLAKMMLMYLNGGRYGGKQYLSEEIIALFNIRYFDNNRRGLAWDKKDGKRDSASQYASDKSFGHTGFTGTMLWADPQTELIYIFLSNRIFPNAENRRLNQYNTRTLVHDVIYESVKRTD